MVIQKDRLHPVLKESLKKIYDMKERLRDEDVIVEGFSLQLALPPSITINFRFKDEKR